MRKLLRTLTALTTAALAAGGLAATASATPAATTHAGAPITVRTASGDAFTCTLTGTTESDGVSYGMTAGHCLSDAELGSAPVSVETIDGDLLAGPDDLAAGGALLSGGASPSYPDAGLDDFSWFRLADGVEARNVVASTGHAVDLGLLNFLLTGADQELGEPVPVTEDLVGKIICKDGAMTGRTCGPVISVNTGSQEVFAAIPAIAGDSGSPLHVTGDDGREHVVGTLSNGTPVLFNIFDGTAEHLPAVGA
jgi:hypothetical protein